MKLRSLVIASAALAVLATPCLARSYGHERPSRSILDFILGPRYCPPYKRTADGDIQDACGWRRRQNYGWDSSCITARWISSRYACSHNAP
jgi:hypothetical protein